MQINRYSSNLNNYLKPGKVLVIYGPRQAGKTTLVQNFLKEYKGRYKLDSGDNISIQTLFSSQNFETLKEYAQGYDLLVIDEAQEIPRIGQALKILVDQMPHLHVIATGSSSFELAGQIGEPLTGRKTTLMLYPIAQYELAKIFNPFEMKQKLENFLINLI